LEEKRQTDKQRKQAQNAISVFYEMQASSKPARNNRVAKPTRNLPTDYPMQPVFHQDVALEIIKNRSNTSHPNTYTRRFTANIRQGGQKLEPVGYFVRP